VQRNSAFSGVAVAFSAPGQQPELGSNRINEVAVYPATCNSSILVGGDTPGLILWFHAALLIGHPSASWLAFWILQLARCSHTSSYVAEKPKSIAHEENRESNKHNAQDSIHVNVSTTLQE
jgi:hypothetical protein